MRLLNTWKVAGVIGELNFKFYLLSINLNLNIVSHLWLVDTLLSSMMIENIFIIIDIFIGQRFSRARIG